MKNKELERIVKEFKNNNYESFDEFYNLTARQVYIFVFDILKNREKTEDVLQEAYMRFIHTIDRYKKNTSVKIKLHVSSAMRFFYFGCKKSEVCML
jgi:DNA-directed RNA polymerase specialized sigma24 family protein